MRSHIVLDIDREDRSCGSLAAGMFSFAPGSPFLLKYASSYFAILWRVPRKDHLRDFCLERRSLDVEGFCLCL
uniref:Uncharacterized protein n=1 Tax=Chromera velia CCMP2878 TaxID=1169474 RepID=A0A0G4HZJ0_9ALVE|eukprot:Cvel_1586.t1-p1 / transcript=Cvel_1586.t1 / gene=Cvel_1586 / organism=Chromera_velia_CCMP2878 / gene_product=hypothetical protein / transcript_product=hypothetical protein / location=Cvel_scaffold56:122885-123389(+) / protein_length=72 / sequence_SO=supercontig / SO=protein_coding / is_pseudo=false